MSKHTPGPWTVEDVMGDGPIDVCGPDVPGRGSPNLIATALTDLGVGGDVLVGLGEAKANARLIAAAPDLLEAAWLGLRYIAATEHSLTTVPNIVTRDADVLRAAIAKAEGE